jgi:hypothetical protein
MVPLMINVINVKRSACLELALAYRKAASLHEITNNFSLLTSERLALSKRSASKGGDALGFGFLRLAAKRRI